MRLVDLFCGACGMGLGMRRAGHETVLALDKDEDAVETAREAGFPAQVGDVGSFDYSGTIPDPVDGIVDGIVAGPPCQGFSSAGKRLGARDPRNGFPALYKAVDVLGPEWLLIEQVEGLLHHSAEHHPDPVLCPGCYFEEGILCEVRERFEVVSWRKLDAVDVGGASHRKRVFIVGGPRRFRWPDATHGDLRARGTLFGWRRTPHVSVREALKGLAPEVDLPGCKLDAVDVGGTASTRSNSDRSTSPASLFGELPGARLIHISSSTASSGGSRSRSGSGSWTSRSTGPSRAARGPEHATRERRQPPRGGGPGEGSRTFLNFLALCLAKVKKRE